MRATHPTCGFIRLFAADQRFARLCGVVVLGIPRRHVFYPAYLCISIKKNNTGMLFFLVKVSKTPVSWLCDICSALSRMRAKISHIVNFVAAFLTNKNLSNSRPSSF